MSGSAGKSLLQAVATVSGSLTVDEPGTVSVAASSVAREFSAAEARNLLISAVANAVAEIESGGAAISLAESVAQSYAMAVADAFIQAVSVELSSTGGGGDACGQATIPSDNAASTVVRDLVEVRPPLWPLTVGCIDVLIRFSLRPPTLSHLSTPLPRSMRLRQ